MPFEYNYQKNDNWLFNWALRSGENIDIAKNIERAKKNVKIKHFVSFEKNSKPWEHFEIKDRWDRDYYKYSIMVKSAQVKNAIL